PPPRTRWVLPPSWDREPLPRTRAWRIPPAPEDRPPTTVPSPTGEDPWSPTPWWVRSRTTRSWRRSSPESRRISTRSTANDLSMVRGESGRRGRGNRAPSRNGQRQARQRRFPPAHGPRQVPGRIRPLQVSGRGFDLGDRRPVQLLSGG